jgi:hypothetical protein
MRRSAPPRAFIMESSRMAGGTRGHRPNEIHGMMNVHGGESRTSLG